MLRSLALPLLLTLPLGAQVLEPSTLGLQGRISLPEGTFRDALGGLRVPGFGVSLLAEIDLGDSLRFRPALGADLWPQGKGNLASDDREIKAFHLSGDFVYFLRDDGAELQHGPYLVAGLGGYAWSLGKDVTGTGQSRRVAHAAITAGFGWRAARHLDLEVKVLTGRIDPGLDAFALVGGMTYRF